MRTLGVNVASDCAYLSIVDDGRVVDAQPYSLGAPQGLAGGVALVAFKDDFRKILATYEVRRLRVLDPEATHRGSYVSFARRYTLEAIIVLAGAEQGIDSDRISRASVRSILSLPRQRSLQAHASGLIEPTGPYWSGKRDAAALAALAGSRS